MSQSISIKTHISLLVFLVCTGLAAVTGGSTLLAQELAPSVIVNMDKLPADQRLDLQTMATDVRNYLANQSFTGNQWEGEKIPLDVTIYILSRNGNQITARLAMVSKRLVANQAGTGAAFFRVFDQDWSFNWSFSAALSFQTLRYDEFASVIDFYTLIAIGMDMDTYDDLGGTGMYKKAQQIAQLGNTAGIKSYNTFYQPGEFTRMSIISELINQRYEGLRRIFFDYHDAIDLYATDKQAGRQQLTEVISSLATYKRTKLTNKSVVLQVFMDAKQLEIADIYAGMKDSPVWADLRFLDPAKTQAYEEARSK